MKSLWNWVKSHKLVTSFILTIVFGIIGWNFGQFAMFAFGFVFILTLFGAGIYNEWKKGFKGMAIAGAVFFILMVIGAILLYLNSIDGPIDCGL